MVHSGREQKSYASFSCHCLKSSMFVRVWSENVQHLVWTLQRAIINQIISWKIGEFQLFNSPCITIAKLQVKLQANWGISTTWDELTTWCSHSRNGPGGYNQIYYSNFIHFTNSDFLIGWFCATWHWVMTKQPPWRHYRGVIAVV